VCLPHVATTNARSSLPAWLVQATIFGMGSYFFETAECEGLGVLEWSAAACDRDLIDSGQLNCDLCGTQRAPRRYHDRTSLVGWLEDHAEGVGNADWLPGRAPRAAQPLDDLRARHMPEERDRCICCSSQLAMTIAIPRSILDVILHRLTNGQRRYLLTEFMIVACGGCRNTGIDLARDSAGIRRLFCQARRMDRRAFDRWQGVDGYREIELIIDDELRRIAV
jgi:hypothetical protein